MVSSPNKNISLISTYPKWGRGILITLKVFLFASSALLLFSGHSTVWATGLMGKELEIVQLTNNLRQQQGLPILLINEQLNISAEAKAENMAVNGYFSHADKNGIRMGYWITSAGYNYLRAGENLAKGFTNTEDLMTTWINSPTHYANLINMNYREIGVGITQGYIDGRATVFVVQHFGEPMPNINLFPVNMAKSTKSVMGDSLSSTTSNNQILIAPSGQSDSRNESTTINTSPVGLLWVAYQDTKNILQQPILPVSIAAGVADVGLSHKGYQVAQILFVVVAFLGFWGWLSMLMWPIYAWLNKLRNRRST